MNFRHFKRKNARSASEASTVISANLKLVKLAILGATGVGKSSVVKQYVNNTFEDEEDLGMMEVYQKQVNNYKNIKFFMDGFQKIINGESFILEIMDMGHELNNGDTVVAQHLIGADGYMLIFSIFNLDSLTALSDLRSQIRQARKYSSNPFDDGSLQLPMVIVANKIDLSHESLFIDDIRERLQCYCLPFVETSAKTGQGIQEAFDILVEEVEKVKNPAFNHLQMTSNRKRLGYVQNFFKSRCIIL